jgi:hypothetical protein
LPEVSRWEKKAPDKQTEDGGKKTESKAPSLPKDFDKKPVNEQLNWLQRNAPNGTEFTIKETGNSYRIVNGKAVPIKKDKKEQ